MKPPDLDPLLACSQPMRFAILPSMFEDDEPYMPYVLAMGAGASVALFLLLVGAWLFR